MAQFPLIGSIFLDLVKKNKPDYSAVFSNHVAGNMHRFGMLMIEDQFLIKIDILIYGFPKIKGLYFIV